MAILKVICKSHARCPELVPRAKYHDEDAFQDVISYCFRQDKTSHHYIGGIGVNPSYAAEQMAAVSLAYQKTSGIQLRHMILSFDKKERISTQKVAFLAHDIAAYYGNTYQIVYAVHEDQPVKHIHFVMNTVSYLDGHKYAGHRDDYYRFQSYVRQLLREHFGFSLIVVSDHNRTIAFQ